MAKITFIEADGTSYVVDAQPGMSLMKCAVNNGVKGILADCGGNCACGTCRIYVPEEWRQLIGKASELEEATIEMHEDPGPGKRLSCQVTVTEEFDGLVVSLPSKQF